MDRNRRNWNRSQRMQMKALICLLGFLLLVLLLIGRLLTMLLHRGDREEMPEPTPSPHVPVVERFANVWVMEVDQEGILIYRDARIADGFPIHEIAREDMKPADLLFFPGHIALYMGDGRYCHSTGRAGDDGFTINSLIPSAPDYRADLAEKITQVGSYFG